MHAAWVLLIASVVLIACAVSIRKQAPVIALGYAFVAIAFACVGFYNTRAVSAYVALPLTLAGLASYAYGRFIKKEQVVKPIA